MRLTSASDPEESIRLILNCIGHRFKCDRTYVFEFENLKANNSYEWCCDGVNNQLQILQNIDLKDIDWWIGELENNKDVKIHNLEELREKYPPLYAILKPQDISSLIVAGLYSGQELIGFCGMDNPDPNEIDFLSPYLRLAGFFITNHLKQRDMKRIIQTQTVKDSLTEVFGRKALFEHFSQKKDISSVGLIYCDIRDLEKNNIKFGSQTGDKLLKNCVRYIREKLNTSSIYRVNGDEFAVICYNLSESDFMKKVKEFKRMNSRAELVISVGYVWTDHLPLDMDSLLKTDNELNRFLEHAYYDLESMLRSISQQNMTSYFFFGDMQKNLFYISDNLKEDFGFQSNNIWIHCYGILKWNKDQSAPLFFSGRITHQDEEFVVDPVTNFPRTFVMLRKLNDRKRYSGNVRTIGFSFNNITEINNTKGRNYINNLVQKIAENLIQEMSSKSVYGNLCSPYMFLRLHGIQPRFCFA